MVEHTPSGPQHHSPAVTAPEHAVTSDAAPGKSASGKPVCCVYMYRDESNYKQWSCVHLDRALTHEEQDLILNTLDGGRHFLPDQVGLSALQERWGYRYEDDHVWHEWVEIQDATTCVDTPGAHMSAEVLVLAFASVASDEWNLQAALERLHTIPVRVPPQQDQVGT
jgi:hypothetical protein